MGTYNRLHTSLVCPRCGVSVSAVIDCHFGYTAAMQTLQVGDRYPVQPSSPVAESVSTDGEGYMECPSCQKDAFLRVLVRAGVIVGVEPDTERQGYIPGSAA